MLPDNPLYQTYLTILHEELVPATGCTEPVAIAYAAAMGRELLGERPGDISIRVSGNIIKNVKSVVVPGTGGLKGIKAAVAAGIVAGDAEAKLQVIAHITPGDRAVIEEYMAGANITVCCSDSPYLFDIDITLLSSDHRARARIIKNHTNIVLLEKDGISKLELPLTEAACEENAPSANPLCVADILDFADTVRIEDIRPVISRQIQCNTAISQEGLSRPYGANIGKTLIKNFGGDVSIRARAAAAAGSDARMSGCELPVVIVSGSGNQGLTASLPVIEFAKELRVSEDKLYRALALSVLVTVHQKAGIGRLSAFCGATSAGCGAGAGIAYLYGGGYDGIAHTIVNTLAIVSGMVCDGAKPSCAAKIASAVDAAILGCRMYQNGDQFYDGDGIIKKGVDNTICNVGRLAREGMYQTDRTILKIMTEN